MMRSLLLYVLLVVSSPLGALENIERVLDEMNVREVLPSHQRIIEKLDFDQSTAAATASLHRITNAVTHQAFILKEENFVELNSLEHLNFIKNHFQEHPLPGTSAVVITPIATYTLGSQEESARHFVLMPEAPGQSMARYMDNLLENEVPNKTVFEKDLYSFGKSLAMLHLAGLDQTTASQKLLALKSYYVHRDLHGDNIFYNNQTTYLIDNDLMWFSLQEPTFVAEDLRTVFSQTLGLPGLMIKDELSESAYETLVTVIKSFVRGYMDALPPEADACNQFRCLLGDLLKSLATSFSDKDDDEEEGEKLTQDIKLRSQEELQALIAAIIS